MVEEGGEHILKFCVVCRFPTGRIFAVVFCNLCSVLFYVI